jgi:DNA-binding NtrC family response regulator
VAPGSPGVWTRTRLHRRRPSLSAEPLDAFDPDHRRQRQCGHRAGRAVLLHDIDTLQAQSPAEGLALLESQPVDLVIQDMNFSEDTTSGEEGEALFAQIRARHPDLPVILLTAWTHLSSAVDLVKAGAADYLAKPWDDRKLLTTVNNPAGTVRGAARSWTAGAAANCASAMRWKRSTTCAVRFADPASERVIALACQVARSELPVLITGPNGAGKEKIAQIIQANLTGGQGPVHHGQLRRAPSELIEAELFGAEAGAYTGANKAREGKFEAADGGTLFWMRSATCRWAGR